MPTRPPKSLIARTVAAATALTFIAAACGGDDDDSADEPAPADGSAGAEEPAPADDPADVSGTITLLGPSGPLERIVADYNETYPDVDVEIVRLSSGEMSARMDAEFDSGQVLVDVVWTPSINWLLDKIDAGDLQPLTAGGLDHPAWTDYVYGDKEAALMYAVPWGIVYNTEVTIESYEDLVDPQYNGLIGTIDPGISEVTKHYYYLVGQTLGEQWLTGIFGQDLQLFSNGVPALAALSAGELQAFIPSPDAAFDERASGAPMDLVFPDPELGVPIYVAVPELAPNADVAQTFIDWLTTPDGQASVGVNTYSVLPDVPDSVGSVSDLAKLLALNEWDPVERQEFEDLLETLAG